MPALGICVAFGKATVFACMSCFAFPGVVFLISVMISTRRGKEVRYWIVLGSFVQLIPVAILRSRFDVRSQNRDAVSLTSLLLLLTGYALLIGFLATSQR